MLQSTGLQRVGHGLITERRHNHLFAVSSLFCLADSLSCSFSSHDYSVLPVMFRVCSVARVHVGPFKVTVTVHTGTSSRWSKSSWVLCLLCILLLLSVQEA